MTQATHDPVELIPGHPQTLWGWRAVVNFVCGGLGAGFYVAATLAAGLRPGPSVTIASWLGPLLVAAGFVAVATEAGRPFRGARVLARPGTSWMSRELWIGGAFVLLASAELVAPAPLLRTLACVAAVALALAQGFILRRARAVAAWDVPVLPAVVLASAVLSGVGLLVMVEAVSGRAPEPAFLGAAMLLVVLGALVWLGYVTWSRDTTFTRATRSLREGSSAIAIVGAGYLVPFLLLPLTLARPGLAVPAATLAGALMIVGQIQAKAVLILTAGQLRPITLANLSLTRRSS